MNRSQNRFFGKRMILAVFLCGTYAQSGVTLPQGAQEKLAVARRMTGISEASREAIEEQLASLETAENASPRKIAQYRDSLKRIREIEHKQRMVLGEMESLYAPFALEEEAVSTSTNRNQDVFTVFVPRQDDASNRLDQEFKRSLESFDAELLSKLDELAEEMEELEEDATSESSELAAAIEAAQQRLEQNDARSKETQDGGMESQSTEGSGSGKDGDLDQGQLAHRGTTDDGEMSSESSGEGMEEEPSGSLSSIGGMEEGGLHEGGEMGASELGNRHLRSAPIAGESGKAVTQEGDPPEEFVIDSRNDDIISRQLREAAEKETDPELKKKLWAEYRRYKESSTR